MRSRVDAVGHRIFADFLMPSRLGEYRRLLQAFLLADYAVISVETFWTMIKAEELDNTSRYLVLRHDIDTDPSTARAMWEIEQELAIEGSFFFRLATVDIALMNAIAESGCSVSYHYEELATIAKRRRLKTGDEVRGHIAEAQEDFLRNISNLRSRVGVPMDVVASHGDFVNRRLGIPNWVILADKDFRRRAGIDLETYDDSVMTRISSRHSDTMHPRYWINEDPRRAITRGDRLIYLLVHPRHWRTARGVNMRDNVNRMVESIRYAMPLPRGVR